MYPHLFVLVFFFFNVGGFPQVVDGPWWKFPETWSREHIERGQRLHSWPAGEMGWSWGWDQILINWWINWNICVECPLNSKTVIGKGDNKMSKMFRIQQGRQTGKQIQHNVISILYAQQTLVSAVHQILFLALSFYLFLTITLCVWHYYTHLNTRKLPK